MKIIMLRLNLLLIIPLAWLLTGCGGQVITRITPTPTMTPTIVIAALATPRPTATPAPYTPAPTATPTVTPTPLIYALKSGDTLLGLAIEFGTTLQAIQDANGITDPRGLLVGQQIIIPREAAPEAGTPTPTASPMPFAIGNMTFNYTPIGGLWGFGEIHNTTGSDLEQASVIVNLRDAAGKTLTSGVGHAQIDLVAPDGRAPFAVHFQEAPASFASYTAFPATGIKGYVGSYYRDLAPKNMRGEGQRYSAYTVSGIITNTGPEDAVGVTVTVTIYDALGRVIGTRKAIPEHNVIPRGGETSFSVTLTPAGGPVQSFRVTALGRRNLTPTPTTRAG
ncbi:MAG: LysM protein [Chloroflexota bacterium]|nr:LysM protein [Chloroflexota bacterium]